MYIGLIGTNGAGKTAVSDYYKTKGFTVFSLSDIVRQEATRLGRSLIRVNLVKTGNELKAEFGDDVLAIRVFDQAAMYDNVVFDSVRHPAEVRYLKAHGVRMIGLDAPIGLRYERIHLRQSETDAIDFETFRLHDQRERSGESSGQKVDECLGLCEHVFQNDGLLETVLEKIDRAIA